jgi:hypothetical protein
MQPGRKPDQYWKDEPCVLFYRHFRHYRQMIGGHPGQAAVMNAQSFQNFFGLYPDSIQGKKGIAARKGGQVRYFPEVSME